MIKNDFFSFFFKKNLHISKKSCTFAADLKNKQSRFSYLTYSRLCLIIILTIKNSQL